MRKSLVWLVLLVVLCSGCLVDRDEDGTTRIGCAGDSNTAGANSWCDRSAVLMPEAKVVKGTHAGVLEPVQFLKRAFGGMPVCNNGGVDLATNLVEMQHADIVIAALGTNDLVAFGYTPEQVVACYQAMQDYLGVRQLFVALTPPVYAPFPNVDSNNALIDDLNARLRATFHAGYIVDFHDGFTADLYGSDGVHLNAAGQQKRAERAAEALRRP